jgi:hypothetical protein
MSACSTCSENWIEQVDLVARGSEGHRPRPRTAADIDDDARRARQGTGKQLATSNELEPATSSRNRPRS